MPHHTSSHSWHTTPQLGKVSPRLLIGLALLLVLAVLWFWLKPANKQDKDRKGGPPAAVGVAVVQRQDAVLRLSALGTVTATNTAVVHSRVDGQLMRIHFTEGQLVQQGQLLAELDPRPYQAALTQAEGQLLRDQALLQNAQLDLQRYRQLLEQNSTSKQQVDTQAALVRQYQGTVKLDQGAVDNARLQLTYSRITAPISGRVGLRQVDLGNIVRSSDANGVVVITQTQPVNVLFAIPETSLSALLAARAEQPDLNVEAWDRDSRRQLATGQVLAIDNQLNTSTGTINVKASFTNTDQQLFPNQFVNIQLQLGVRAKAITVPTVAIQLGRVGSYVYTVNTDNTVSMSKVTTGPVSGDNTIIEQGLKPGQKVVVDGLDKLRDGATVRAIDRAAQARSTSSDGEKPRQSGAKARPAGKPAANASAAAAH